LVKPDGFERGLDADGTEFYTAEISYPIDRESLLLKFDEWRERWDGKAAGFGFHYNPYNTDSNPEKSFFELLLEHIGLHPDRVEDIYFTGAITDPRKTDFFVEYKDEDGKWHRYTPDFIIRRKDGKCLIVEIKAERDRNHTINGENGRKAMALRQWENLNPDRLKYQMLFVCGGLNRHASNQENQSEETRRAEISRRQEGADDQADACRRDTRTAEANDHQHHRRKRTPDVVLGG
jgi:type III restriction enzyme